MPSHIQIQETLKPGSPVVIESPSPSNDFMVVFEDDGKTGYLYGLDRSRVEQPILDALHVYNVTQAKDKSSVIEIVWTDDGLKACLLIDHAPQAVFDFQSKHACCRNNFPPPDHTFTDSHAWDDRVLEPFRLK